MKNCIYALTRGYKNLDGYKDIINRNKAIEDNISCFLDNNVDYILFHEGNILEDHQKYIQSFTNISLSFIDIHNFYPKSAFHNEDKKVLLNDKGHLISELFCEKTKNQGWDSNQRAWGLNYRHMCEFHFIYILQYLRNYKYGLRIDEDCIIQNKVNYFDFFKDSKLKLISGIFMKDCHGATINLNKFCNEFKDENKINYLKTEIGGPYTNVFLLDLEYFRNHILINKFIEKIKNNQYIIIYRWGDLPLWGEVCNLFLNKDEYNYYERNIKYYHGSHGYKVNF